jgi:tRNA modification GTPase
LFNVDRDKDTICAVATPPGVGGISVIRVSGQDSLKLVRRLCGFIPTHPESHRVYYGKIKNLEHGEDIDEVLVTYFAKGKSFTGEQTLEISTHGSPIITQETLNELIKAGCRIAEPGEFTYRAFMGGRIDLVQAESVLSLIESQSKKSARLSLRQLEGALSKTINELEDQLTLTLAHLEANIDFASEDIEIETNNSLKTKVETCYHQVQSLIASYDDGRKIQQGLKAALIGDPNVGKSSLLNRLCGEEKAIVTDVAGTTRDFVEGKLNINGQLVHLIDTAGLRKTEDQVESIGVQRTIDLLSQVDVLFVLLDLSKPLSEQLNLDLDLSGLKLPIYIVGNKLDLVQPAYSEYSIHEQIDDCAKNHGKNSKILKILSKLSDEQVVKVSAVTGQGVQAIHELLKSELCKEFSESSAMIFQSRHFELLTAVSEALSRALIQFDQEESPEFIALELQDSLKKLQEIVGKQFDDEVMDRVFKEFCLGK